MASNEREELAKQSAIAIEDFIRQHPEYSVDDEQPKYRGGTNLVTFGHCGQKPIVFKYFIRTYRWVHEYFCLRHFAKTGHVPEILAVVPERMVVMSCFPSSGLETEVLNKIEREQVSREIGQAVADLVQWPLPKVEERPTDLSEFERFSWRSDIGEILGDSLRRCRRIQELYPAYQAPFFSESFALAEQCIDFIDQQPRILFHEDMPNLSVHEAHFQGFYDLEMVRVGTEALQLGVAVHLCRPHWVEEPWLDWHNFLIGYQSRTGRTVNKDDQLAILAMSHFYYHLRLCRWGEWDGNPMQTHHLEFAMNMADHFFVQMRETCYALQEWVDLNKWFPSLT
ncbi:hypothetical protein KFU94_06090 [Chloroflexi bacterium TSY]|nr:hypothetical protein [Chloroflexi bacterium TSY]